MKTKKILITGVAGNIGSSLCKELLKDKNNYIIGVDNLSTGKIKNIKFNKSSKFTFIKCDVNNKKKLNLIFKKYKINFIFHYAAVVGVQRTLKNPLGVLNDIEGIKNILENCKKYKIKRLFFSSSSEVYGEPFESPQNELTTPLNSRLPYAIVKNVCESYIKTYHKEYGINYTILRLFNTFGPSQSQDFVITKFIKNSIRNKNIEIYGDGKQTRSFIYIEDNINFTKKIFYNEKFINQTVNLGNDEEITVLKLAKKIIDLTNSKSNIVFKEKLTEGDMNSRKPDISKMKKYYKNKLISLENGILKTIKFFKNDI